MKESLLQRCQELEQTAREQAADNAILDQLCKVLLISKKSLVRLFSILKPFVGIYHFNKAVHGCPFHLSAHMHANFRCMNISMKVFVNFA